MLRSFEQDHRVQLENIAHLTVKYADTLKGVLLGSFPI